jgi:hypothetical protein
MNMSATTQSNVGNYLLLGDTYFKHVTSKFGHIGHGDVIVYKDCDGNFAELYHDDGETIVTLLDLGADDLDLLPDLSFDTMSKAAKNHLLELGFSPDNLPQ